MTPEDNAELKELYNFYSDGDYREAVLLARTNAAHDAAVRAAAFDEVMEMAQTVYDEGIPMGLGTLEDEVIKRLKEGKMNGT